MTPILTIAGLKGGVGKTTTSVNLAAELAALGHRVRLVDLDPQSSATLSLGLDPVADPLHVDPEEYRLQNSETVLEVFRGGRRMAHATEAEVRAHLERASTGAEVLVVDTSPALMNSTRVALAETALVLAPIEPAPLALPALRDVAEILAEQDVPAKLRAVLVRVRSRRLLTADVAELLDDEFPGVLYDQHVPEDVRASEAPGWGQPLHDFAPASKAALAYQKLAKMVQAELEIDRGAA